MAVAAQDTKISCVSWGNQWSMLFFNACKSSVNLKVTLIISALGTSEMRMAF